MQDKQGQGPGPAQARAWQSVIGAMCRVMLQLLPAQEQDYPPAFQGFFMMMACLPALLLRICHGETPALRQGNIATRCSQFLRGHWKGLWNNAQISATARAAAQASRPGSNQAGPVGPTTTDQKTLSRAVDQARRGNLSRSMSLLRSAGLAPGTPAQVVAALQALHPPDQWNVSAPPDVPPPPRTALPLSLEHGSPSRSSHWPEVWWLTCLDGT